MAETIYTQLSSIKSCLSFQPLLRLWQEAMDDKGSAAARICAGLHQQFSAVPDLLRPINDDEVLRQHKPLIEEAMTTLFPPGFSRHKELYAVATPFSSKSIYASSFFKETYLDENDNYKLALDPQVEKNVVIERVNLAYKLILKKYYGIELIGGTAFICSYPEREHNIHNYFELEWDPQFIDVSTSMDLPPLPDNFLFGCHQVRDLVKFPILATLLPLEKFQFEGLVITRIREVSERETVSNIRSILQRDVSLESEQTLLAFQQQMIYLLRMEDIEIGLTAFYDSEQEVELPAVNFASVLLRNAKSTTEMIGFSHLLLDELQEFPNWFWHLRNVDEATGSGPQLRKQQIQQYLDEKGWKNALITALYQDQKVIGCLEIMTKKACMIDPKILLRLEHVRDVLQTALQQYRQQVQNKISALVKEHFTAVQTSVEWKFNNAAIRYLLQQHHGQTSRMMPVVFDNVFPLYGAIDIKNSTGERNKAIQQDLLTQLQWVKAILDSVQQTLYYPLLQEVLSRTNTYLASVSNFLFAADEQLMQHFLRTEVAELLQYLSNTLPAYRPVVEDYLQKVNNPLQLLNENRQKFEDSVTKINTSIAHYLEKEQEQIQKVYPHYFERFVTDGVEFNMYVGQSIVPAKKFHSVHLKNLRLWQLHALANAAREVHRLSGSLHLPLQTTQLVLVYNEPIAIRFRNAERKFDVDGVHHARYEVVKKRIDKALVKGSSERITQPGTITIVYSGDEEAKEYLQYIDYLKTQDLVTGTVEELEVEDLQSVSGLRALRVTIRLDDESPAADGAKRIAFANDAVR